ncbi:MAG: LD-carboxypeptidase [Salinicola sp.]|uniref:S66 peptidase family protein n=1 Tax=uncultured Salinicola sp. TaxID=1193542 RepID=UPI000C8E7DD8|nr:LD-carboxypeptidase [uncultured Salinicola sp.]MAM56578.1 LD-carboxypeptidase [Salinicola sp.]
MSTTFSLIAPASFTRPEILDQAAEALRRFGIEVRFPAQLQKRHRYLAGDVDHRLKTLHEAYADPDTDAVWAVRGGYGCAHLATEIDWQRLPSKPLIGYSDLSVLLDQCHRHGLPAIHGPVMKEGVKLTADNPSLRAASHRDFGALLALLEGRPAESVTLTPITATASATIEGPLVGGNLSTLASVAGTPLAFQAPPGAIVILEDVGEPYYRLERDLWQLAYSGALDEAAAVCIGTFDNCVPYGDLKIETLFEAWLTPRGLPLYAGLPIGHGRDNLPWRYGATGRIADGRLQFRA